MNLNIKIIKSNKLLKLRSKILRNNINPSKCAYPGDDDNTSFHIGAYIDGVLAGGVSMIKNKCTHKNLPNCYQLRGLFVDFNHQKKGIGKMIIKEVESLLKNKKVSYLWMNARVKALDFYLKLNYTNSEITYNINEIGLHYMLYKKL
ncbi:MAG: GNAT family N-acetyltransferase [Flavobacteriaceae bacterium]